MKNDNYEQYLTTEDKRSIENQKCLNPEFVKKLGNTLFSFRNITAKNIIDIVYEGQAPFYISTSKICEVAGITLNTDIDNKEYKGNVRKNNKNQLEIVYDPDLDSIERRFIRAHELGHIFKHLIIGEKPSIGKAEAQTISRDQRDSISKDTDLFAAFSVSDIKLKKEDIKKEDEATEFALELILSEDVMKIITSSKDKEFDAQKIQDFCRISRENLEQRLSKKDIFIGNAKNNYEIKI